MECQAFDGVQMRGYGEALPPRAYSNEDVFNWHGRKSAEWIGTQIGNQKRYTLFDYETGTLRTDIDEDDLAVDASRKALKSAQVPIADIDAIIFSTISPTHTVFPDSACTLHRRLEASTRTTTLTITTGCAGTLSGLMLASSMVQAQQARNVLVVSASSMSAYIQPHLKDKMWLYGSIFGDGVSAIVVGRDRGGADDVEIRSGFSPFFLGADPTRDVAAKAFGGTKRPVGPGVFEEATADYVKFDFRSVPENLHVGLSRVYDELTSRFPALADQTRWVLFNMSNTRVQKDWLQKQNIPEERWYFNQARVGNCGAASLGLILGEFAEVMRPKRGTVALVMTIGTGLQYGGAFYRF